MIGRAEVKRLREGAKKVLYGNIKEGVSSWGQEYFYICPSLDKYPYQWLWDSCLHAIVMRHFDVNLARKEMFTLLSMVQKDGFLPHIIYWQGLRGITKLSAKLVYDSTRFNRLTQPPIIAMALEKIYEKDKDRSFLEKTLPAAERYYRWLMKKRDIDGDRLVSIIHPWEAGADANPIFDEVYRIRWPNAVTIYWALWGNLVRNRLARWDLDNLAKREHFNVESVGFNTWYAQNLRSLSCLFGLFNENRKKKFFEKATQGVERGLEHRCYDPKGGLFYDLAYLDKRRLLVTSYFSILPVILDSLKKEIARTVIEKHILNPKEFWLPYPVPSVPKNNPEFNPGESRLLWRGPTWVNTNWFVYKALKRHGYKTEARRLLEKTMKMILRSGFREYFNPLTGEGFWSRNFGWTTLIVDMLED